MTETKGSTLIALLLIGIVTVGAVAGVAAADGDLGVTVDDADGEPTVTVTENASAVENATVNVTTAAEQNVTYAGVGEYSTDENGTVDLPAADENVTVNITATSVNTSVSTTVDLTTGEDHESAAETPFGQLVSAFIQQIDDRDGGIGAAVSDFVTENNPGNADDAPGHDRANDGERGPPDHAGPSDDVDDEDDRAEASEYEVDGDDEADSDDDDEDDDADENDEAGDRGPPAHAGR